MRFSHRWKAYLRFLQGLPAFLATPISYADAAATVEDRLNRRDDHFLELVRTGIFENPASPYLPLFRQAACGYADVEDGVRRRGIERTLEDLYRAGVWLSLEEFMGRVGHSRAPESGAHKAWQGRTRSQRTNRRRALIKHDFPAGAAAEEERREPKVSLRIIRRCNYACPYCSTSSSLTRPGKMRFADFRTAVRRSFSAGSGRESRPCGTRTRPRTVCRIQAPQGAPRERNRSWFAFPVSANRAAARPWADAERAGTLERGYFFFTINCTKADGSMTRKVKLSVTNRVTSALVWDWYPTAKS